MPRKKRIVNMRVLPGEPLDGTGRICIHLFVPDPNGKFVEPHAIHPVYEDGVQVKQKVQCKPTRGKLACNIDIDATPRTKGGVTFVTVRTDDPRAVTCTKCIETEDWKKKMGGDSCPQD